MDAAWAELVFSVSEGDLLPDKCTAAFEGFDAIKWYRARPMTTSLPGLVQLTGTYDSYDLVQLYSRTRGQ